MRENPSLILCVCFQCSGGFAKAHFERKPFFFNVLCAFDAALDLRRLILRENPGYCLARLSVLKKELPGP